MDQSEITLTIIGMAVVTFVPRLIPVLVLSSKKLPEAAIRWLGYVPVTVLSAMLFPSILIRESKLDFSQNNLFLWISIPTFLVAFKSKSLFGTVIAGMIMVGAVRLFSA